MKVGRVLEAVILIAGVVGRFSGALAAEAGPPAPPAAQVEPATGPAPDWREEAKRMPPPKDYRGDFWTRPAMTGDWGGLRNDLAQKGLTMELSYTQALQGNVAGGREFRWPSQASTDLTINLDTGKMGLWPGGYVKIRAENRFGHSANPDTGALLPANTDSLFPVPEEDATTLSEVTFTQFLSPKFAVTMGKFQPRDSNVFASNETTQFMNMAFAFDPVIGTTVPLDFLGAGVIALPTDWLTVTALVLDSEGQANTSGFDTAFDRGVTVVNGWEFTVKPFGQVGHQRFNWAWSDRRRAQFEQNYRLILRDLLLGLPPAIQRQDNDWAAWYDFDQYLYTVKDHPDRGFGVFGRVGFGNGTVNLAQNFYSVGVGGKGVISGRPNDRFGVGYYYLALSDHLPRFIRQRAADEQGVEVFYNIAVTPWLTITPDLQVIDPASRHTDTTVVAGVRVQIVF
jgi:porin